MSNDSKDTIFIGKKPLMTYVTSTIVQLATKTNVTIKARGLTTAIAIDVAQVVLKKTKPAFEIGNVSIGSEALVSSDGRNRDVSTIEISIKRTTA
jgi:DNA-binding protein|tara:strand:+ start:320 stop:604 length:285 start_codon:yes stop_codon:yes gene_type:complete